MLPSMNPGITVAATLCVGLTGTAQCTPQWGAGTNGATRMLALSDGHVAAVLNGQVAIYDGAAWRSLGGAAVDVAELPTGELIAAHPLGLTRWNGAAWVAFAPPPPTGPGLRFAVGLPSGGVAVAGSLSLGPTTNATTVEVWDGAGWQVIGTAVGATGSTPFSSVFGLDVLASGELVALGDWSTLQPAGTTQGFNELMRWDGARWHHAGDSLYPACLLIARDGTAFVGERGGVQAFDAATGQNLGIASGGTEVRALVELPDGDVVAGGVLNTPPFSPPVIGLQRFDGSGWSTLGFGTTGVVVEGLAFHGAGQLLTHGTFSAAGGVAATNDALLRTPCAALASAGGAACTGPAGRLDAAVVAPAWAGAVFVADCSGFVAGAVGAVALGASAQQQPLAALTPRALPGCDLLVVPAGWEPVLPQSGTATWAALLPAAPVLVQQTVYLQFLQLGAGPGGTLSSSNGLAVTVGSFD